MASGAFTGGTGWCLSCNNLAAGPHETGMSFVSRVLSRRVIRRYKFVHGLRSFLGGTGDSRSVYSRNRLAVSHWDWEVLLSWDQEQSLFGAVAILL